MKTKFNRSGRSIIVSLGTVALLIVVAGCQRDVRLADSKLRDVEVKTVQRYGITLNKEASPKQVAYVLLRAMSEDFHAKDTSTRGEALDTQFAVSAANEIVAASRSSLTREEVIYRLVHRWTPTVSYYINSIPTTWEDSEKSLTQTRSRPVKSSASGTKKCEVILPVKGPSGASAVVNVVLFQDEGYWRVFQVGCIPGQFNATKIAAKPSNSQ